MKGLVEYISESLNEGAIDDILADLHGGSEGRPFIFLKTGMSKQWVASIEKVLNLVPNQAKPEFLGSFAAWKKASGRKITAQQAKSKFGVTIKGYEITIPKNKASQEILDRHREVSTSPEGDYDRLMEIKKDITLHGNFFKGVGVYNIVGFNSSTFKTPNDITSRKETTTKAYKDKTGNEWWLNKTGEDTICHEFGHVFDNNRSISGGGKWTQLWNEWVRSGDIPDMLAKSESEAFAEAFANTIMHKGKDLPTDVYKYVKSVI